MAAKVIIVAPKVVSDFLADEYVDWDTQIPCETIAQMWNGLNTGELSDGSEIVFIIDTLFSDTPDEFIEAVAMIAPEALVMILSYTDKDEIIRARVAEFAQGHSIPAAAFYSIPAETALQDIEETLIKHDPSGTLFTPVKPVLRFPFRIKDESPKMVYAPYRYGTSNCRVRGRIPYS